MKRIFYVLCLLLPLGLAGCATSGHGGDAESSASATANARLGIGYLRDGKHEKALERLKRAIEQQPDLTLAHMALGLLYERVDEPEKAETHYKKAVALEPDNSRAHNNYGKFLCQEGRYREADKQFRQALDNPVYSNAHVAATNAGLCAWQAGESDKAERYLRTAIKKQPEYEPALYQLAQLSYQQEKYLQARAFLQRYDAVADHTPSSLWLAIQTERKLGAKDSAASYALQLKRQFPDSQQAQRLARDNTD